MAVWRDIIGTTLSIIRVGIGGVALKNSTGNLIVRNTGDSADSEITASKVNISGNVLDINSDAAGSGADWKYTLQRPAAGMTAAVVFTLPVDDGTPSQVLQTDGAGVLSFVSAGSTAAAEKLDTTSLAFGTTSPLTMFSTGAADIIIAVDVIVDTAFNGTPSLSIGIAGTTSKYMSAGSLDLTAAAGTVFRVSPGLAAAGAEALIATYSAGGATAGAARIIVHYATPT